MRENSDVRLSKDSGLLVLEEFSSDDDESSAWYYQMMMIKEYKELMNSLYNSLLFFSLVIHTYVIEKRINYINVILVEK